MTTNVTSTTIVKPDWLKHVPTPAGAVSVEDWYMDNDGGWYRLFSQAAHEMPEGTLTMRGIQYQTGDTHRAVFLASDDDDLHPKRARRLAAMLQNFADTCEILDGSVNR